MSVTKYMITVCLWEVVQDETGDTVETDLLEEETCKGTSAEYLDKQKAFKDFCEVSVLFPTKPDPGTTLN